MSVVAAAVTLVGITVASAAFSAYTSVQQGASQAAWNKYNAKVAKRNAKIAAESARIEAEAKRRETRRLLSHQGALYGKAGATFEGSPLLVMEETAAEGELEALLTEYRGVTRSQAYRSQAEADKMRAEQAKTAGWYGAGTSLLGAASDVANIYWKKKGQQ